MTRKSLVWFAAAGAIALAMFAAPGCRPPADAPHGAQKSDHGHEHDDEHDHEHGAEEGHTHNHAMPTGYCQAIAQIQAGAEQIAKAIGSGDFEAAHAPLDEIDPIIGQLMSIAKQSGVPRKDWEMINVARRELRAEFDKLHAKIDAGERPDYSAARNTIEDRLNRLHIVAVQLDRKEPSSPAGANAAKFEKATP